MSGTSSPYPNGSLAPNDNNDAGDDDGNNFHMGRGLVCIGIELGDLHLLSELMLTKIIG